MRAVGYVRVSTAEQSTEGVSLDAQRAKLEAYAALYDIELQEIIEDSAASAKSLKRDGLDRALQMLDQGHVDGLLVAKLDRLTRNVGDWQTLVNRYFGEKAGKQLFSVSDSVDTRTAGGRLVLNVLCSASQWERETIGERTSAALRHKQSQGEVVSRAPRGLKIVGTKLEVDPTSDGLKMATRARELRLQGLTYRAIAETLTADGFRPKRRGAGNAIAAPTVRYMLAKSQGLREYLAA